LYFFSIAPLNGIGKADPLQTSESCLVVRQRVVSCHRCLILGGAVAYGSRSIRDGHLKKCTNTNEGKPPEWLRWGKTHTQTHTHTQTRTHTHTHKHTHTHTNTRTHTQTRTHTHRPPPVVLTLAHSAFSFFPKVKMSFLFCHFLGSLRGEKGFQNDLERAEMSS